MEPRFGQPKMRDAFRRELRAQLMEEAVFALAPRPRRTTWAFLRPALAVSVATVMLFSGAGVAAASSLPGDAAFGLKRAAEELQVTLTFDDVQRVELLAQIADRRIEELQQLAALNHDVSSAAEEVAAAVARFRAAVDALQQAAPHDKAAAVQELVEAARAKHEAVLQRVQEQVGNQKAKDALERAKNEEDRDTHDESVGPNSTSRPERTPRPGETARPQPTPRAADRTTSPRSTR